MFIGNKPEMHENYKSAKLIMQDLYPAVFDPDSPKPLTEDAINKIKTDPYICLSDEQLEHFFTLWQARREYSLAVCKTLHLHDEDGERVEMAPYSILADKARHLAKFSEKLNMSNRKWKEVKGVVNAKAQRKVQEPDFNPWGKR